MLNNRYYLTDQEIDHIKSRTTVFHSQGEIDVQKLKPWLEESTPPAWLMGYVVYLDLNKPEHLSFAKEAWSRVVNHISMEDTLLNLWKYDQKRFAEHLNAMLTHLENHDLGPPLWLEVVSVVPDAIPFLQSSGTLEKVKEDLALDDCFFNQRHRQPYIQVATWMSNASVHGKKLAQAILKKRLTQDLGNKDANLEDVLDTVWAPLASDHYFLPFLSEGLKQTQSKLWIDKLNTWSKQTESNPSAPPHHKKAAQGIQQYMAKSIEPKIKSKKAWTCKDMPYAENIIHIPRDHPLRKQALIKLAQCATDAFLKTDATFGQAIQIILDTTPELAHSILKAGNVSKAEFLSRVLSSKDSQVLIEKPVFQALFPQDQFVDHQLALLAEDNDYKRWMRDIHVGILQNIPVPRWGIIGFAIKEITKIVESHQRLNQKSTQSLQEKLSSSSNVEIHALLGLDIAYTIAHSPNALVSDRGVTDVLQSINTIEPQWLTNNPKIANELTSPRLKRERAVSIYNQLLDDWFGKDSRHPQILALFDTSENGTMLLEHFKQCYRQKQKLRLIKDQV